MIERRIKELSIALEALSRINSEAAQHHSRETAFLLDKAIDAAKQQSLPPMMSYADALKNPNVRAVVDDEVPF